MVHKCLFLYFKVENDDILSLKNNEVKEGPLKPKLKKEDEEKIYLTVKRGDAEVRQIPVKLILGNDSLLYFFLC
jgi:hypothetical protein